MSFASFVFIPFVILFFLGWLYFRGRPGSRSLYLLVSSLIFYGYAEPRYVLIFLISGLSSWLFGRAIEKRPTKGLLAAGLSVDIGILTFFKYSGFLTDQLSPFGIHIPKHHLVLPIGISFYTFMSIAYLVDIYRRAIKSEPDPKRFLAYLSLWPHLVAGPIVRPAELLPQMMRAPDPRYMDGARLIVRGFLKKLVLADNLAPEVSAAFTSMPSSNGIYWWVMVSLFSLQVYFDFSGYTDIARGLARWIGYEFPLNFDAPFGSKSLVEFWRRWHISLSNWFRDYIYISLGGSKKRAYLNLWITFLLSGLWHGAAWHFVLWGLMNALFLTLERLIKWPERLKIPGVSWFITMCLFVMGCAAFRSQSLDQAMWVLERMVRVDQFSLSAIRSVGVAGLLYGLLGALFVAVEIAWRERWIWFHRTWPKFEIAALAVAAALAVYWRGPGSSFVYFQF